jgi:hypothetical protein
VKARLPPLHHARRISLPVRTPHTHPPEVTRARLHRRSRILHIQRLPRRDPPAVPYIRLAGLQHLRPSRHHHPICRLLRATRRIIQLPREPRRRVIDPQWPIEIVYLQMHRPLLSQRRHTRPSTNHRQHPLGNPHAFQSPLSQNQQVYAFTSIPCSNQQSTGAPGSSHSGTGEEANS